MAIAMIEEFTVDILDFQDYDSDRKTQSAVERQLVIVGEALNQFRKSDPLIDIQNDHQIVAFRNRLVHAYDGIDNTIVWAILSRHLKPLKEEVTKLLFEQDSSRLAL
jgi:uncharacterized protein with HEPN domain